MESFGGLCEGAKPWLLDESTGEVGIKGAPVPEDFIPANPGFDLSSLAKSEADPYTPKAMRHARRRERNEERPLKNMSERTAVEEACCAPMDASAVAKLLMTQALMLVYIVSDAGRTLILQKALSTTVTNSTVMGLVCFVVGVVVASCITAYFDGLEGLRCAWQPEKILQHAPAPFMVVVHLNLSRLHGSA
ncbi:hypothetical protein AK812_SmicGene26399 [Symbiodinium microadriaticum]|uniref:Uncharacterized protein n=1 Tax=Symbiodinium microadriaticum TaxID=2951 RepID=A0A1Q9D9G7_SYMMI|nr:hypothetical protein AK812_SmicGene26399 [Symbiodinium microadriaticum]